MISKVNRAKTDQDVLDERGAPGVGGRPGDGYKAPRQNGVWGGEGCGSGGVGTENFQGLLLFGKRYWGGCPGGRRPIGWSLVWAAAISANTSAGYNFG